MENLVELLNALESVLADVDNLPKEQKDTFDEFIGGWITIEQAMERLEETL